MAGSQSNISEFSVSEISFSIKKTMEDTFGYVRVRGELGRISRPGSGHIYLDLKDDKAVLNGVVWRGVASKLKIKPEQGLEVIATGKITTFPGQSKYQMVIDALEPAGAGALMALLEERKKKLAAEGLFAEERKQPLPGLPRVIGVVTSPSGAVIRDILHRISDRFPLHVLVWPVRVQGETCGPEVAHGIRGFNALTQDSAVPRPDVLIVARGGGSLEDLWGFNEEAVVRAAAESQIPLISAVGHETDWTLIDLAADVRAPTPTGAAEIAVPVKADLMASIDDLSRRLASGLNRFMMSCRTELRAAGAALPLPRDLLAIPRQRFDTVAAKLERGLIHTTQIHRSRYQTSAARLMPLLLTRGLDLRKERLSDYKQRTALALRRGVTLSRQRYESTAMRLTPLGVQRSISLSRERLDSLSERMNLALSKRQSDHRQHLSGLSQLLQSLSYKNVLARGYAVVRDENGQPVRSVKTIAAGQELSIELTDGTMNATAASENPATDKKAPSKASKKSPPAKGASKPPSPQGSLF